MASQTNQNWWDAQHVVNQLRLRLVRERDSQELRKYLSQDTMVHGLLMILTQAGTAPTRVQAVEEVTAWLDEKKSTTRHVFVHRRLQSLLLSVLNDVQTTGSQRRAIATPKRAVATPLPARSIRHETRMHTLDSIEIQRGTTRESLPEIPSVSGEHVAPRFRKSTVTDMPYVSRSLREKSHSRNTSETLEEQSFSIWWDSKNVVDSMRLRLENHPVGSPLRRLLLVSDFFPTLLSVLQATERMSDFRQAQQQVAESMDRYCNKLNFPVPSQDLWSVLQPLLNLRKVSSASAPAIEVPWMRLREIEAAEKPYVSKRQQGNQPQPKKEELWDWDDNNREFQSFAGGAMNQIIEATRSSDSNPAIRPSSVENHRPKTFSR